MRAPPAAGGREGGPPHAANHVSPMLDCSTIRVSVIEQGTWGGVGWTVPGSACRRVCGCQRDTAVTAAHCLPNVMCTDAPPCFNAPVLSSAPIPLSVPAGEVDSAQKPAPGGQRSCLPARRIPCAPHSASRRTPPEDPGLAKTPSAARAFKRSSQLLGVMLLVAAQAPRLGSCMLLHRPASSGRRLAAPSAAPPSATSGGGGWPLGAPPVPLPAEAPPLPLPATAQPKQVRRVMGLSTAAPPSAQGERPAAGLRCDYSSDPVPMECSHCDARTSASAGAAPGCRAGARCHATAAHQVRSVRHERLGPL